MPKTKAERGVKIITQADLTYTRFAPAKTLRDGRYHVGTGPAAGDFVVKDGWVTEISPVLRRHFEHWKFRAKRVGDD